MESRPQTTNSFLISLSLSPTCPQYSPSCLTNAFYSSLVLDNCCIASHDFVYFNDFKRNCMSLLACFFLICHVTLKNILLLCANAHVHAPTLTSARIHILSQTHTLKQTAQSLKMKPQAFRKLPGLREKSAARR